MPFDPGIVDKNILPGSGVVDYKLQRLHFLKSIESGEFHRLQNDQFHQIL